MRIFYDIRMTTALLRLSHSLQFVLFITALLPSPAAAKMISREQKDALVRRARVWSPVEVESMDLRRGPEGSGARAPLEKISCTYEEKDPLKPIGGHSPKFPCHDAAGERLKVKYGVSNPEVYAEVAATRLFWALGFPAERMYSVKILCANCPPDPFTGDGPRAERLFEPATVQKRQKGEPMWVTKDEGWTFDELDGIDEKRGGSPRAEVDALKILAAFVNHADNTPNQQTLLCLDGDAACAKPVMYVNDLGGTFGGREAYVSFKGWSRRKNLWKDPEACVLDFTGKSAGYKDPKVSEAGRALLAGLLSRLSDAQIRDLFVAARFDLLSKSERPLVRADGKPSPVTVDDWVAEFKRKRAQIVSAKCSS